MISVSLDSVFVNVGELDLVAGIAVGGDVLFVPKDNHISYEADDRCVIFYAAYPHDWKQRAGITFVPGIDPEDMPKTT